MVPAGTGCELDVEVGTEIVQGSSIGEVRGLEQRLAGSARGAVVVSKGQTCARRIAKTPAKISGERAVAEGVVGALALRFEIRNARGIIEIPKQTGKVRAAAPRREITSLRVGSEFRNARGSTVRENLNHPI